MAGLRVRLSLCEGWGVTSGGVRGDTWSSRKKSLKWLFWNLIFHTEKNVADYFLLSKIAPIGGSRWLSLGPQYPRLQGQVWLKRRPPSQPGTKRNLQYLEGLQAFYTSSCNPSGLCFLASPLTAHRRLAEPASPCTVRLALLEVPWKHGEWCLLTVEARQAWLRMDGPFRSPVGGALVREALLMATACNPSL